MFTLLQKKRKPAAPAPPQKRVLDVDGRAMPLTVTKNPRATRLTLRIEPGGRGLKLTVPPGLKDREVNDFLDRHQGWLRVRLAKFSADNAIRPGSEILFRGIPHRIVHTGELRGLTQAIDSEVGHILSVGGLEEHMGRRIATFFKKEARKDLEAYVAIHTKAIGKPARSLSLKDTRSRWGSCSWEGNLSFSWRIVMAPPGVINYLAAHEVAHLREMNHGPGFWSLCERLCPDMEEAKRWLKRHGSALHAIDFE